MMDTPENIKGEALLPAGTGEIILYQPDDSIRLEVKVEYETVWLTQAQMVELFKRDVSVISRHIGNIFKEGELDKKSNLHFLQIAFSDKPVVGYSLDVIISVGYRVKSKRGTQFRIWANRVLKEYLLKGYVFDRRIERVENFAIETERRVTETEKKIDFLVNAALPSTEWKLKNEIMQLERYIESVLTDYNDINEDTRTQLELVNQTLAKLQSDRKLMNKPRNPIGFLIPKNDIK